MNAWWKNRSTGARVFVIGKHPMKDAIAVTGGEDDVRWIPWERLVEFYEQLPDMTTKETKNGQ